MWSSRVLLKYWGIQAAGWIVVFFVAWVLADRFAWPRWTVWTICAIWVAKDAVLYPFVWRSYASYAANTHAYPRPGTCGVALRRLNPTGIVRVEGEIWNAGIAPDSRMIEDGERIRVTGRDGMTLLVEAAPRD